VDHILSSRNREVLRIFARSNGLIAMDFDGTLAPIVDDPDAARLRPQTQTLLKHLCRLYPCMVISGRAHQDVAHHLGGSGIQCIVGNHGGELGDTRQLRKLVAEWKAKVEPAVAGLAGVWIEDKKLSLAIHYRQSPQKALARRKILRLAGHLQDARLIPAKQALNLVSRDAPHKGIALEAQKAKLKCDTALYVGDDVTDEDVFSLPPEDGVVGIRVGMKRCSQARFWLRQQSEIDDLLRILADLRENKSPRTSNAG